MSGFVLPSTVQAFSDEEELDWKLVRAEIVNDSDVCDKLLKSVRFNRNKKNTRRSYQRVKRFLLLGYALTRDVRYYNEFLFLIDKIGKNVFPSRFMVSLFERYTAGGVHCHSTVSVANYAEQARSGERHFKKLANSFDFNSVMLLGSPHFFEPTLAKLGGLGFKSYRLVLQKHSNRVLDFVFKRRCLLKIAQFILGASSGYKVLKESDAPVLLTHHDFAVGFHKLSFIIPAEIHKRFSVGLINDHWSLLPFLRGRSVIEYSLLLGYPICSTTHFVESGIDEGDIVEVFNYDSECIGMDSVEKIKKLIKSGLGQRIVESFRLLRARRGVFLNNVGLGKTYYEIHPELTSYINLNLFPYKGAVFEMNTQPNVASE